MVIVANKYQFIKARNISKIFIIVSQSGAADDGEVVASPENHHANSDERSKVAPIENTTSQVNGI